jgi:phage terminase Nu1 subunit (DNA packaging protein)
MPTVEVQQLTRFLNLSERRICQLVKEGMPKEARGQYDPIKCAARYIRYLQNALEKKAVPTLDGGFAGEREERVRLIRADADLKEIELAKERGQLIVGQDVRIMTDLVITPRQGCLRCRRSSRVNSSARPRA